jgi:hypothetical protein
MTVCMDDSFPETVRYARVRLRVYWFYSVYSTASIQGQHALLYVLFCLLRGGSNEDSHYYNSVTTQSLE